MSLFAEPGARWFSIPANRPFLDDLARGLTEALGPEALSEAVILVPNRRAARTLSQAFVGATKARAMLLPQIRALGDLEEGEPPFEPGDLALDLPLAVSPYRRRFELARLAAGHMPNLDTAQALEMGDALGRFFDSLEIEEVENRDKIHTLVEGELAAHWQVSARFLALAVDAWPARLKEMGLIDPKAREVRLLRRLAQKWGEHDPGGVVVAAGSTGSTKATAAVLIAIAGLRQGAVVLPGLDDGLADDAWGKIDDQHPQGALKRLLEEAHLTRGEVREWRHTPDAAGRWRRRVVNEALRPADATADWRAQIEKLKAEAQGGVDPIAAGLSGLSTVSAANEEECAAVCALLLREALAQEGKTAALVTPDPALARRVSARLARWDIEVDSSAGSPLGDCPTGVLIALVARALLDRAAPVTLLALLKHPMVRLGTAEERQTYEAVALRGTRPRDLAQVIARFEKRGGDPTLAIALDEAISLAAKPFASGRASIGDAATGLTLALETLADRASLWAGAGGEAAGKLLAALIDEGAALPPATPRQFLVLIERMLAQETVRLSGATHRRIQILGALEGRLIGADRLVLAGLEEGTWPPNAPTDPFLSRPMREALGLPPPERRIGLSAHDFAQAACAPEVIMVHSDRRGGQPAVRSRWLWRLETLAKGADLALPSRPETVAWARGLDDPGVPVPAPRPAPTPPVEHRPDRLAVTRVETLVRDPYAIWAYSILKLKALDRPDRPIDARIRGTAIHEAFEHLADLYAQGDIPDAAGEFETLYMQSLEDAGLPRSAQARERVLAHEAALWVEAWEDERRAQASLIAVEKEGVLTFDIAGRPFTVTAKTDRLEFTQDGAAHILDYKTGRAPSKKMVETGFSPQLTLTAAILAHGTFAGLPKADPGDLLYIEVTGRKPPGRVEVRGKREDSLALAQVAFNGLHDLISRYRDPATPYPSRIAPQFVKTYKSDFDHLARVFEWSTSGDDEGGE